jgi:DnaK suppressor protein
VVEGVDIEAARTRLSDERARVSEERRRLFEETSRSIEDTTTEDGSTSHLGDTAAVTLDREIDLSVEDNADHLLQEIDAALARIDAGTYGECVRCGRAIDRERLEALPYAAKCIECKRLEERG